MLLFRSEEHVTRWCRENGIPRRPLVSQSQLWELALAWYSNRITEESRRPAPAEIKQIFARLGLEGPFWAV